MLTKFIFKGSIATLLVVGVVILSGCSGGWIESSIKKPILRPNKFYDGPSTPWDQYEKIYEDGRTMLTFEYTGEDIGDVPKDEWGNIEVRFHIEAVDREYGNPADNAVSGSYYALINGVWGEIPRPVGRLSHYSTYLSPGQNKVDVEYIASDVSGVYKVVAEAYYKGDLKASKEVVVEVKIPYLEGFSRQGYDSSGNMIWNVVGQTEFHTRNNYVQYRVGLAFAALAYYIKDEYAKANWGDTGFIVRVTDMSLPWGGMFWIGYPGSTELTIPNRIDGYGNTYTITYRAGDNRIYAPPHSTHRDGRHIDISFYSDNGNGYKDWSRRLEEYTLRKAIEEAGTNFSYIEEGDHYHLTCKLGNNYYYDEY
ncbi:MAG: hypothetical protein ACP5KI_01525 [Brevinematia bacterium]